MRMMWPGVGALCLASIVVLTSVNQADVYSKWGKIPGQYVSEARPGVFFEVLRNGDLSQVTALCQYDNAPRLDGAAHASDVPAEKIAVFTNLIGSSWPIISQVYGVAGMIDIPFTATQTVRYVEVGLPVSFEGSIGDGCMAEMQNAFLNHLSTICVVQSVMSSADSNVYVQFNPWAVIPPRPTEIEASAWPTEEKACPLREYSWFLWPLKEPLIH